MHAEVVLTSDKYIAQSVIWAKLNQQIQTIF